MTKKELECGICGGIMKVSKRKYRKWEDGEVVIYCKECWRKEAE